MWEKSAWVGGWVSERGGGGHSPPLGGRVRCSTHPKRCAQRRKNGLTALLLYKLMPRNFAWTGEYLKAKRALLRSVEKQAAMAEKLDSLKSAVADGNLAGAEQLLVLPVEKPKGLGGDIESLGERDIF